MKTITLILIILTSSITLLAQTSVEFLYDAAGNRTSRSIELPPVSQPGDTTLKSGVESDVPKNQAAYEQVITTQSGETSINIYPNPNGGKFTVEISELVEHTPARLQLRDLAGTTIVQKSISTRITDIDISSQPPGTYMLLLHIGKQTSTWKIVKQ